MPYNLLKIVLVHCITSAVYLPIAYTGVLAQERSECDMSPALLTHIVFYHTRERNAWVEIIM